MAAALRRRRARRGRALCPAVGGVLAQLGPLDVDVGQDPVEPARQPPGAARRAAPSRPGRSSSGPRRRRSGRRTARAKPMLLMVGSPPRMKLPKTEIMIRAAAVTTRAPCRKPPSTASVGLSPWHVVLAHPADQEDLVVHGEPEEQADQEDRQEADDRPGAVDAERRRRASPTGRPRRRAERGADAEQEAQRRLERHQERPEDDHQQQEREADDQQQEDRQRVASFVRDVDVDRGVAGDQDVGAGLRLDARRAGRGCR